MDPFGSFSPASSAKVAVAALAAMMTTVPALARSNALADFALQEADCEISEVCPSDGMCRQTSGALKIRKGAQGMMITDHSGTFLTAAFPISETSAAYYALDDDHVTFITRMANGALSISKHALTTGKIGRQFGTCEVAD